MALVFVSHAAVDGEIAKHFQNDVKADFLGMCEIFVSSNLDSLQAGFEWDQVIKRNLKQCSILVGLLSPESLTRGWIYTEFGAGWIRDIPTIPVCHSGAERGQLPPPISSFQGLNLWEADHLEHLYGLISQAVGCQRPNIDFAERAQKYFKVTETVRIQRVIVSWLRQLMEWNPALRGMFDGQDQDSEVMIPAHLDQPFQEFVNEAHAKGFLIIERKGMGMGTRVGPQASIFHFVKGANFDDLRSRAQ